MRIEVDFGKQETIDNIAIDCSHDQTGIRLRLEGQDVSGRWKTLSGDPAKSDIQTTSDLRRAAIRELKRRGITHLLTTSSFLALRTWRSIHRGGAYVSSEKLNRPGFMRWNERSSQAAVPHIDKILDEPIHIVA